MNWDFVENHSSVWRMRNVGMSLLNHTEVPYWIRWFVYIAYLWVFYDRYEAEYKIKKKLVWKE